MLFLKQNGVAQKPENASWNGEHSTAFAGTKDAEKQGTKLLPNIF